MKNKQSALIAVEQKIFSAQNPDLQLNGVLEMGALIEQIRQTGMAGQAALVESSKRIHEHLIMAFLGEAKEIHESSMLALMEIVPFQATFVIALAKRDHLHPYLHNAVTNLIDQEAFDCGYEKIGFDHLIRVLLRYKCDEQAIRLLDSALLYASFSGQSLEGLSDLFEEMSEGEHGSVMKWAISREELLVEGLVLKTLKDRLLLTHTLQLAERGLTRLGYEIAMDSAGSAYGNDLLVREQQFGIKLSNDEIKSGKLMAEALLIYLFCAPDVDVSLDNLSGYQVSYSTLEDIEPWIKKSVSGERYIEVLQAVLCHSVTIFEDFVMIIERYADKDLSRTAEFHQIVFDAFHPKCLNRLNDIVNFAKAAKKRGVVIDPLRYRVETDAIFRKASEIYGADQHLKVLKKPEFIRLVSPDLVIEMTEFNLEKAPDKLIQNMANAAPKWLVEAIPQLRKNEITQAFGI